MAAKQAKEIEQLFVMGVGVPIVIMGASGFLYAMTKD